MSAPTRVCSEHAQRVEPFSSGRYLCEAKTGPNGHRKHICSELETRLLDPGRFTTLPGAPAPAPKAAPAPAPARQKSSVKTLIRWKGSDGSSRTLWLHALSGKRKTGDLFVLRWAVFSGKKTEQGCWATAPDEQAARREFAAEVARQKAAGWREDTIGGQAGRLVLRPVPAPLKSKEPRS